jgi:hypothetical protein
MTDQVVNEIMAAIIIPDASRVMPPAPPQNFNFVPGEFNYIKSESNKKMMVTAYKAITLTENWNFMKMHTTSFMFSKYPQVEQIYYKIEELGYTGHSGSSFAIVMRKMQYIAKNGEEDYMKEYLK